jgi:hypothetical protein
MNGSMKKAVELEDQETVWLTVPRLLLSAFGRRSRAVTQKNQKSSGRQITPHGKKDGKKLDDQSIHLDS